MCWGLKPLGKARHQAAATTTRRVFGDGRALAFNIPGGGYVTVPRLLAAHSGAVVYSLLAGYIRGFIRGCQWCLFVEAWLFRVLCGACGIAGRRGTAGYERLSSFNSPGGARLRAICVFVTTNQLCVCVILCVGGEGRGHNICLCICCA